MVRNRGDAGLDAVIRDRRLGMMFQPIFDLATGELVGVEALARIPADSAQSPVPWFQRAGSVGRAAELDLVAAEAVVAACEELPVDLYLAVNLTPAGALDRRVQAVLGSSRCRLVVEITEHAVVDDYESLNAAAATFRKGGARIAVDDAGAGWASLRHVLELRPEIVKLDQAITARITSDPVARALTSALVVFAREVGSTLLAEGIEVPAQLDACRELGVAHGQGYLLGRPGTLAGALVGPDATGGPSFDGPP
ncbi:MAG: hypothetical protein QOI47_866 [Actinomycetota bacterium]|nr:hypothetical protein [Actinomycetota bacterium]